MVNKECLNCKTENKQDRDLYGRKKPQMKIPRRDPYGKVILNDHGQPTYED